MQHGVPHFADLCRQRNDMWRSQNSILLNGNNQYHLNEEPVCCECKRMGEQNYGTNITEAQLQQFNDMKIFIAPDIAQGTALENKEYIFSFVSPQRTMIDIVPAHARMYYIQQDGLGNFHCLVWPDDCLKCDSAREGEPITIWIHSSNIVVRRDWPSRSVYNNKCRLQTNTHIHRNSKSS